MRNRRALIAVLAWMLPVAATASTHQPITSLIPRQGPQLSATPMARHESLRRLESWKVFIGQEDGRAERFIPEMHRIKVGLQSAETLRDVKSWNSAIAEFERRLRWEMYPGLPFLPLKEQKELRAMLERQKEALVALHVKRIDVGPGGNAQLDRLKGQIFENGLNRTGLDQLFDQIENVREDQAMSAVFGISAADPASREFTDWTYPQPKYVPAKGSLKVASPKLSGMTGSEGTTAFGWVYDKFQNLLTRSATPAQQNDSLMVPAKPRIYLRSEWQASAGTAWTKDGDKKRIIVHHTARVVSLAEKRLSGAASFDAAAAHARFIQDLHKGSGEYVDVAYHYAIDWEGRVLQLRPIHLLGAHAEHHNSGSIGVVLMGAMHQQHATGKQLKTLKDFLEFLTVAYKIHPLKITGHHDWNATECPGHYIDNQADPNTPLRAIRRDLNLRHEARAKKR
jgi:hypothetical protein